VRRSVEYCGRWRGEDVGSVVAGVDPRSSNGCDAAGAGPPVTARALYKALR
jgi:hypothetical protein